MCTEILDLVSNDLLNEIGAYGPECSDAMFAPKVQDEHLQLIANHTVIAAQELLKQAQAQIEAQNSSSNQQKSSTGLNEGYIQVTYLAVICTFTMMVWLFLTFAVRICCPKDFEEHDADEQIVEGAENRESPNMGGAYRTTTELTFVGNKNFLTFL